MKFDLEIAFNSIGVSLYPYLTDDYCCRLLAWLYVHGGGVEATVQSPSLNGDILLAQKRLNIYGGETPNAALILTMQGFIKELEKNEQCTWLDEICKRYNLKHK